MTHASPEGGGLLVDWLNKCRDAACESELVGFFDCQGELAPAVKQAMPTMDNPDLRRWAEMDQSQRPDEGRL